MSSNRHNVSLDRVRDVRSERGLSQGQLANRTGITQTTISRIERLGRGTYEQAEAISRGLNARMMELSWDGYNSLQGSSVRAGEAYQYAPEPQPETETTDILVPSEAEVESETEVEVQTDVTHTYTVSDAVLERVDRVLDIVEGFIFSRR